MYFLIITTHKPRETIINHYNFVKYQTPLIYLLNVTSNLRVINKLTCENEMQII